MISLADLTAWAVAGESETQEFIQACDHHPSGDPKTSRVGPPRTDQPYKGGSWKVIE